MAERENGCPEAERIVHDGSGAKGVAEHAKDCKKCQAQMDKILQLLTQRDQDVLRFRKRRNT